MAAFNLRSYRQQNLLIEFASLRHIRFRGIYVSLSAGDPTLWAGVIFVKKGPYAPAVLRFHVSFPQSYPFNPPLVTFGSDTFHPLLIPLTTTHTYSASSEGGAIGPEEDREQEPGGFILKHGFPDWQKKALLSFDTSDSNADQGSPALDEHTLPHRYSVVDVLKYLRSCFEDESILDSIPFEMAGNPGAWYAWQAHRGRGEKASKESAMSSQHTDSPSGKKIHVRSASDSPAPSEIPQRRPRRPSQWNWEGVWEERVKRAVQTSLSESMLYGGSREDEIHFVNAEEDELDEVRKEMQNHLASG